MSATKFKNYISYESF